MNHKTYQDQGAVKPVERQAKQEQNQMIKTDFIFNIVFYIKCRVHALISWMAF